MVEQRVGRMVGHMAEHTVHNHVSVCNRKHCRTHGQTHCSLPYLCFNRQRSHTVGRMAKHTVHYHASVCNRRKRHAHWVEPNERHEEPQVSLGESVAAQVPEHGKQVVGGRQSATGAAAASAASSSTTEQRQRQRQQHHHHHHHHRHRHHHQQQHHHHRKWWPAVDGVLQDSGW
jgi:hypothetical protein